MIASFVNQPLRTWRGDQSPGLIATQTTNSCIIAERRLIPPIRTMVKSSEMGDRRIADRIVLPQIAKTLPPVDGRVSMLYTVSRRHSLGVNGADGLAVHTAAEGAAARASHVRQRRSATVRAGNGLGGLGLPVCAARMSIRARGLVLRQCHGVSSISFERYELKRSVS